MYYRDYINLYLGVGLPPHASKGSCQTMSENLRIPTNPDKILEDYFL